MMMPLLSGFLYFVFDAFAILLLVGTWQHTRINGFLVLAASYALGIVSRWIMPLAYRLVDLSDPGQATLLPVLIQGAYLVVAAIGLYGLWDIYRQLKSRPTATSTAG